MGLPKDLLEDWVLNDVSKYNPSLISEPNNGVRKISGQLLSPPDTILSPSRSSSSTIPSPTMPVSGQGDLAFQIPVSMYSEQALEFIGFNAKMSGHLLRTWVEGQGDMSFQDLIFGYLSETCPLEPKNWVACMENIGISKERQTGIMDPNFADVRATRPLRHWLHEFFYENYLVLETLGQRVCNGLDVLKSGTPQLRGGYQDRSDYHLTQVGHTTLYRATSAARLEKVFETSTLKLEKGCMGTIAPNDFSLDRVAYYWSSDHWVAERFAWYTQNNCKILNDVAILRVLCPTHYLTGKGVWRIDFSTEWQKLIFCSRRQEVYPTEIEEKWNTANLIIGPVSIDHDDCFAKMKSWTSVEENNQFKFKKFGKVGCQYAWIGMSTVSKMNAVLEDKLDLFKCFHPYKGAEPVIKCVPNPKEWVKNRLSLHT